MDFTAVVQRARALHTEGELLLPCLEGKQEGDVLAEEVYGRICTSVDTSPPERLATTPGRRTVFLFGPDAVQNIILRSNTYEALLRLGFDRPYIHYEVVEKHYTFWLVLVKPNTAFHNGKDLLVAPATWDGVVQIVQTCYPDAYSDLVRHLTELREKDFEYFESEAGFEFLEARKNEDDSNPNGPQFYSYEHFCSLPRPRKLWQIRLFLYCEMRLLKFFQGDGYTYSESGQCGSQEFLSPNARLSDFSSDRFVVIPLKVKIPN